MFVCLNMIVFFPKIENNIEAEDVQNTIFADNLKPGTIVDDLK